MAHFYAAGANFNPATAGQANQFWVPEIYSKKVQIAFRKASTVEAICNTDYMGEIKSFGDTVNIVKEPQISTVAYDRAKDISANATLLTDEELVLVINKANAFQFAIDSLEKRFGHINFQSIASDNAAYKLKDVMDTEVLSHMDTEARTAGTGTLTTAARAGKFGSLAAPIDIGHAAGETDPLTIMNDAAQVMDEANNAEDNRWWVAAPSFYNQLADTSSKLLSTDFNAGKGSLRNGLVASGLIRGFAMYKSNNLQKHNGGGYPAGNHPVCMFGHMSGMAAASAMNTVETFRSPTTFADVVRGLHVYGRKLLRGDAVGSCMVFVD